MRARTRFKVNRNLAQRTDDVACVSSGCHREIAEASHPGERAQGLVVGTVCRHSVETVQGERFRMVESGAAPCRCVYVWP
jgi:hypothetical protein